MPPPNHHNHHDKLTPRIPPATKTKRFIRHAQRQTDIRIPRHNLKEEAKHAVRLRILQRVQRLDNGNGKERERNAPNVVRELAAEVLGDEAHLAALLCGDGTGHGGRAELEFPVGVKGNDLGAAEVWAVGDGRGSNAHALEIVDTPLDLLANEGGAAAAHGGKFLDGARGKVRGGLGDFGDGEGPGEGQRGAVVVAVGGEQLVERGLVRVGRVRVVVADVYSERTFFVDLFGFLAYV